MLDTIVTISNQGARVPMKKNLYVYAKQVAETRKERRGFFWNKRTVTVTEYKDLSGIIDEATYQSLPPEEKVHCTVANAVDIYRYRFIKEDASSKEAMEERIMDEAFAV